MQIASTVADRRIVSRSEKIKLLYHSVLRCLALREYQRRLYYLDYLTWRRPIIPLRLVQIDLLNFPRVLLESRCPHTMLHFTTTTSTPHTTGILPAWTNIRISFFFGSKETDESA